MPKLPLNAYLAWRLQSAVGGRHFISMITGLGLGALALVAAILIIVNSVMNGFERRIQERIFAALPHIEIEVRPEMRGVAAPILERLRRRPEVEELIPFRETRVMLSGGARMISATMRGVHPQAEGPSPLTVLEPRNWQLVLDASAAFALGVNVGDIIEVAIPEASISPLGAFARSRPFTVAGVVAGAARSEATIVAHIEDLSRLAPGADKVDKWELRLKNPLRAENFLSSIEQNLQACCSVDSWRQRSMALFDALALERTIVSLMLGFIVLIALLNLAATLRLMVEERSAEITMLRLHGASARRLFAVFALQGLILGGVGVALGVALGLPLTIAIESLTRQAEAWLFGVGLSVVHLPVELRWEHIGLIIVGLLLTCLPAVLIPARHVLLSKPLPFIK